MIALLGLHRQHRHVRLNVVRDRDDEQPLRPRPMDHLALMDLRRVRRNAELAAVSVDEAVTRQSGGEVFEPHRFAPVALTISTDVQVRRAAPAPRPAAVARMLLPHPARLERLPVRRSDPRPPAHQSLLFVPPSHRSESTP